MGDANRVRLSLVPEVTYGVTPSANLIDIRMTGESLEQITNTKLSTEIRSDRNKADLLRTNIESGGNINFEFSGGSQDNFFLGVLMAAAWSTPITVTAATISAASADNSFNDSGAGFGSIVANQWVLVTGFVNAANNGYFKIVSQTASKIIVKGGTLVTAVASPSITILMGAQAVNGLVTNSYSIERNYTDLTNTYALFPGICFDKMTLSLKTDSIITGDVSCIGQKSSSGVASAGTGYTVVNSNPVLEVVDNISSLLENYTAPGDLTQFDLVISNNIRKRIALGVLGPKSLGLGAVDCSGSLIMYFATATLFNKYLGFTSSSLSVALKDANGAGYIIDLPQVKFTAGKRAAGGENTDIMADMKWIAYRHPTEGITVRVAKF